MKRPSNKFYLIIVALCSIISILLAADVYAQSSTITSSTTQSFFVDTIVVKGNRRIEESTIISKLNLNINSTISSQQLNSSLKRLFNTGLFNDVRFSIEQTKLIVHVVENPTINYIVIEGNKRINDDIIIPQLSSRSRNIYTSQKVQNDVKTILKLYSASGRYSTEVVPKVIKAGEKLSIKGSLNLKNYNPQMSLIFSHQKTDILLNVENISQGDNPKIRLNFTIKENEDIKRISVSYSNSELLSPKSQDVQDVSELISQIFSNSSPQDNKLIEEPLSRQQKITLNSIYMILSKFISPLSLAKALLNTKIKDSELNLRTMINNNKNIKVKGIVSSRDGIVSFNDVVVSQEDNRINLVFEVTEGPIARIERIVFLGNRFFSDSELSDAISSQESYWYRFVGSRTTFDEGRVSLDQNLLIKHYNNNGFPKAVIKSPQVSLSPSGKSFYITFFIEEGPRYKFGKVSLSSNLPDVGESVLEQFLNFQENQIYDISKIEKTKENIRNYLGTLAYAFAQTSHSIAINEEEKTIDVNIVANSGGTAYIERIDINGNSRTWDKVIRREMRLVEGDIFDSNRVRDSVRRIRNLGILKDVNVNTSPGSFPDSVVLNTNVKETGTNAFRFVVGYSTLEGAVINLSASENNLMGTGNKVGIETHISSSVLSGSIFYHEPHFLDSHISSTFRLFSYDNRNLSYRTYNYYDYGGSITLGYDLYDDIRQSFTYKISQRNISNVSEDSSIYIKSQEGKNLVTSLKQTLSYDKRDNNFNPTSGYLMSLSTTYAMPPGDIRYLELTGHSSGYYSITDSKVISAKLNVGHIFGLDGQTVRLIDRFYKGGRNFRGFDYGGVGPRDISTKESLGGKSFAIASLASKFDIGFPKEYNIKGIVFSDLGTLTGIDNKNNNIEDSGNIRIGYGFGFEWITPVGPLSMLFSNTIMKDNLDVERNFLFSIGLIN